MNFSNYTIKAQEAVQKAQQSAFDLRNSQIETAHLLKALLDDTEGPTAYLLKKCNVNIGFLDGKLQESLKKLTVIQIGAQMQNPRAGGAASPVFRSGVFPVKNGCVHRAKGKNACRISHSSGLPPRISTTSWK